MPHAKILWWHEHVVTVCLLVTTKMMGSRRPSSRSNGGSAGGRLSHPNLVQLHGVANPPETDVLYVVLGYMQLGEILTFREEDGTFKRSGNLRHKEIAGLVADGHFDEGQAALCIVDILHGLAYLHQHHICHRDLKPENILLSDQGVAEVGDFGVSHNFEEGELGNESRQTLSETAQVSVKEISRTILGMNANCTSVFISEESMENPFFLTHKDTDSAHAIPRMAGMLTKSEGTRCFWSPGMCSRTNPAGFSGYAAVRT